MLIPTPPESASGAERAAWLSGLIRSEKSLPGEPAKADFSILALSYREGWESAVNLVTSVGAAYPDDTELLLGTIGILANIGGAIAMRHGGGEYILSLAGHPNPGVKAAADSLARAWGLV